MSPRLFIKRATRESDRWSAHIAFPGGRAEPTDEDGIYTAQRECFEEVGIDLAEPEFLHVGALDDREITTSLGKRLLMILSPYVWLYTGKEELVTVSFSSNWIIVVWQTKVYSTLNAYPSKGVVAMIKFEITNL